jgi:hypothetical protein
LFLSAKSSHKKWLHLKKSPFNQIKEVRMLRNIVRFALLVAVLSLIVGGTVQAQTISTNLNGSATVLAALTITQTTALAFGNLQPSVTAVMDPQGLVNSNLPTTHTVGLITIHGANNSHILVGWPGTMTLSDGTPAENLTLTLNVTGHKLAANQATSASLSSGADVITALGTDPNPGNYYLWFGGSLPSGANTNTFSGTAAITVEYK